MGRKLPQGYEVGIPLASDSFAESREDVGGMHWGAYGYCRRPLMGMVRIESLELPVIYGIACWKERLVRL